MNAENPAMAEQTETQNTQDNPLEQSAQPQAESQNPEASNEAQEQKKSEDTITYHQELQQSSGRYGDLSAWDHPYDITKIETENDGFTTMSFKIIDSPKSNIHRDDEAFHAFDDMLRSDSVTAKIAQEQNPENPDTETPMPVDDAQRIASEEDARAEIPQETVPVPTVISEELLKDLHESAYAKGFQEGRDMAMQEAQCAKQAEAQEIQERLADHSTQNLLGRISESIQHGIVMIQQFERDRDVHLLTLVLEILRKTLPGIVEKYGTVEIEKFFAEIMAVMKTDQTLSVTLPVIENADMIKKIRYILREHFDSDEQMEKYVYIKEDSQLGASDCRVVWHNGMASRDYETIWNDIERILSRHMWLGLPEHELQEKGDGAALTPDSAFADDESAQQALGNG